MKKLSKFVLLVAYVTSVLCVTTIEANGYVYRTYEKPDTDASWNEIVNTDDAVALNRELDVEDGVLLDDEPDVENGVAWDDGFNVNGTVSGNNIEDIESAASDNEIADISTVSGNDIADTEGRNRENVYREYFNRLHAVCEQFMTDFNKTGGLGNSYEKTLRINQSDKEFIAENIYDFSNMKIACLGDSITAASNLEDEEDYELYAYPTVLKELLGAKEVYNLGIGGSSIGRYWSEPFVERYKEIPEDTDIIIVMGGVNDGFYASIEEFGSLEERAYGTFCGDLDELMKGIKTDYPNAAVFFATPMSTALHGAIMSQNPELLPQQTYVQAIETLSAEYGFEFIDLYNTGFLDSYDENIEEEFVPDSTHGNQAGYRVLAERFACEIVKHYNEQLYLAALEAWQYGDEDERGILQQQ
ncbi:MAG: SGNH/GDSL hydrolase family protein [Butyrivibrio sp.]|nr:SGNH/GDSL hydrolase family protein [Butyrivibrio sp.]